MQIPEHAQKEFRWTVRVYFEDTDTAGIVYYANYLKYFERCRTEWLRALGVDQSQLAQDAQLQFVVTDLSTQFVRPARLDDQVHIAARTARLGRASIEFHQTATREHANGVELLAKARVKIACVHTKTLRPTLIPDTLARLLQTGITTQNDTSV